MCDICDHTVCHRGGYTDVFRRFFVHFISLVTCSQVGVSVYDSNHILFFNDGIPFYSVDFHYVTAEIYAIFLPKYHVNPFKTKSDQITCLSKTDIPMISNHDMIQ